MRLSGLRSGAARDGVAAPRAQRLVQARRVLPAGLRQVGAAAAAAADDLRELLHRSPAPIFAFRSSVTATRSDALSPSARPRIDDPRAELPRRLSASDARLLRGEPVDARGEDLDAGRPSRDGRRLRELLARPPRACCSSSRWRARELLQRRSNPPGPRAAGTERSVLPCLLRIWWSARNFPVILRRSAPRPAACPLPRPAPAPARRGRSRRFVHVGAAAQLGRELARR